MQFASLKKLAILSFLEPWRDRTRAKIFLAGTVGVFAASMLSMALNYGIAGEGFKVTISFQIARLALLGFLGITFSYWCLSHKSHRLYVLASQSLGLMLLMTNPHSAFTNAIGFFFTSSPFWAIFSLRFAGQQSRTNHGHEIALSSFLSILSGSAGTFCGGYLLDIGLYQLAIFISAVLFLIATQLLIRPIPSPPSPRQTWKVLRQRDPSTRITLYNGILSTVQDVSLTIWLRAIGQSALSAGTLLALQPILGFIITPIIGRLVQAGGMKSIRVGGINILLGWLLLIPALRQSWLFLPSFALMAAGINLITSAEVNRWFKLRSATGIVAREVALAMGRCPTFTVTLPIIFLIPSLYPITGIATALLFIFGVRPLKIKKTSKARRIA